MDKSLENQVMALAGLAQAVDLVKQVARRGSCIESGLEASVRSLMMVDALDVPDVYGGLEGLARGFELLGRQLSDPHRVDRETARYAATLITLEPLLMSNSEAVQTISQAIRSADEVHASVDRLTDPRVLRIFAEAYQLTLSTMKPRVMVVGDARRLSDPQNADRVRTLLLAGIRAVHLWRQAGGSRWQLLIRRPQMRALAHRLRADLGA